MAEIHPDLYTTWADMDTAVLTMQYSGATTEAAQVVPDLVRSGAYHMPENTSQGDYAILRITPFISRAAGVTIEPLEFKANELAPDWSDWSRESTERALMLRDKKGAPLGRVRSGVDKISREMFFDLLPSMPEGGVSMSDIHEIAADIPSRMLGGIVTGIQFERLPDQSKIKLSPMIRPFWHRALPAMLNTEEFIKQMPRPLRSRVKKQLSQQYPHFMTAIAMRQLYAESETVNTVEADANIILSLPPKVFIA